MASDVSKIIDELWDAKSACEMACHDLTPSWERKEADIRWKHAIEAITQYVESLPTPAVGAAGEAVAWECYVDDCLWEIENDKRSAESFLENGDPGSGAVRSIVPLYRHTHPSAGAVTEAEQDKIEQAEGERIFDRVCEALKLDPNDGDCDSGDHADFIVSAVQRHIERLSVAQPSAGAGVFTDAQIDAAAAAYYHAQYGAQGGRYELVNPDHRHLWREKARSIITAALTRTTSEGREDV